MPQSGEAPGKKVIVIGGGVGGLTAAHELMERGFSVEVYDRQTLLGGKARSVEKRGSGKGDASNGKPRRDLPGEHGFRFFPGFYQHVPDTMRRIFVHRPDEPDPGRTVYQNLVTTETVMITQTDRPPFRAPIHLQTCADWKRVAQAWRERKHLGLPLGDALVFGCLMLDLMCTSRERRTAEYDLLSWWNYVDGDGRSEAYKRFCAIGLTRNLVAMKAQVASTRTVGNILIQFFRDVIGGRADRVLCGPTTTAWLEPWTRFLERGGVEFHRHHKAERLNIDDKTGHISSVTMQDLGDKSERDVTADFYVLSIPVDGMTALVRRSPGVAEASSCIRDAMELKTEWMNGMQFYLTKDFDLNYGHQLHLDTAWSLTSISQRQFWREGGGDPDFAFNIDDYGDGRVKGILSVDISNWDVKGDQVHFKKAEDCTRQQVKEEVWAQLKASLARGGVFALSDDDLHSSYLDPDIYDPQRPHLDPDDAESDLVTWADVDRSRVPSLRGSLTSIERLERIQMFENEHAHKLKNHEPLLINTTGSLRYRPPAGTEIHNLILGSAYVRTNTDLATMESANEAGRRAANAILERSGSKARPARIYTFKESLILLPFRAIDWVMFKLGLPHIGLRSLLKLFGQIQ